MRKHNGRKRKVSFFLAIFISTVVFTLISVIGKLTIYQGYEIDLWKTPILSVMFQAAKDGVYPWDMIREDTWKKSETTDSEYVMAGGVPEQTENESDTQLNQPGTESPGTESPGTKPSSPDQSGNGQEESKPSSPVQSGNGQEGSKPSSPDQSDDSQGETKPSKGDETAGQGGKDNPDENENSEQEESSQTEVSDAKDDQKEQTSEATKSLGEVEQAYFDDVLFIGDSRTVGLSDYSYLDNATYYSDVGLSVYTIFDKKIAKIGSKLVTLEEALKKKQFKKIYIMLGVNELGTGTAKTFVVKYQEMLDKIQKLQPDAYIVIQAIMNLGKEKSDADKIFNNKNITERNEGLETLADNKKIFYINVNDVLTDEDGYLPEDITFDSIHLKAKYYNEWADFLMKNGIVEE